MHISVCVLWDNGQVYCGICEIGLVMRFTLTHIPLSFFTGTKGNDMIYLIHKFQNAPVLYHTIIHSVQKFAHFCCERSIVGCGTGALWDL